MAKTGVPFGENSERGIAGQNPLDLGDLIPIYADPTTHRLYVDSQITNNTSQPTGFNGSPVTVGTTAVELTFTGTTKAISIKAASTNTGVIYFGGATITSDGSNAIGELTADSAVEIELNDASAALYAVASTADQKVYKAALT